MSGNTVVKPIEILLMDDNLEDARVTIQSLKQNDIQWRVTLVGDGEDGMPSGYQEHAFVEAPVPDLIVLDMDLPEKNGHQVLAGIRADQQLKSIPVVVLTDSLAQEAVREAEMLHVDGFMTKPLSSRQFSTVIRSLRQSRLPEAAVPSLDLIPDITQESILAPTPLSFTILPLLQEHAAS